MPALRDEITTLAEQLALDPATEPVATQIQAILTSVPGDGTPDPPQDLVQSLARRIAALWYNAKNLPLPAWEDIPLVRRNAFRQNAAAILRQVMRTVRSAVADVANEVWNEFSLDPASPTDVTWTNREEFFTINAVEVGATYYERRVSAKAWESKTRG